jgi:hypothetical protein
MPERTDLVVRPAAHLASPRSRYEFQLEQSKMRLRAAMAQLRERAHEITPSAQISHHPVTWVLGGLAAGFVLGLLSYRRRR